MLMLLMLLITMTFMLVMLAYMLGYKKPNKEKCFMFECGFNPMNKMGIPFSMSFFIMAILFLVFDMEMMLLFPFFIIMYNMYNFKYFFFSLLFLMMLVIGLMYEWLNGGLEWD